MNGPISVIRDDGDPTRALSTTFIHFEHKSFRRTVPEAIPELFR